MSDAPSRWTGIGEVVKRVLFATAATVVAVGLIGALVGWTAGRGISGTMAGAYYIVGCILFLIGMFPSGGFSVFRGTVTKRKPMGSRMEAFSLLGIVLIACGIVADVTRPF